MMPLGRQENAPEVLIIKPDKLGDFLVWQDAVREYVECFKNERRVLVADAAWSALAEASGVWDEVVSLDGIRFREHFGYRLRFLAGIRRRAISVAINASVRRSFRFSDALVRFSGAQERIGMSGEETREGPTWIQRLSDKWYTQLIDADDEVVYGEIGRQLSLTRAFGGGQRRAALPHINLSADISTPEVCPKNGYVVMVLGAADANRRWPVASFVELAAQLLDETSYTIVLCGTRAEEGLARSFIAEVDSARQSRIVDLCGVTGIVELAGVLKHSIAVVSNETGTMHLAVAMGRPTVCIAGVGDFGHMVPYPSGLETAGGPVPVTVYDKLPCYGCGWNCIYDVADESPVPCVSAVSVEDVWRSLHPLLRKNTAAQQKGDSSG